MSNPYFSSYSSLPRFQNARAEAVNAIIDAVIVGFDLVPDALSIANAAAIAAGVLATVAQWSVGAGLVNATTGAYPTAVTTLTDGLLLGFRANLANTSSTPTFKPDAMTARTITRTGGSALNAGDIQANGEYLLRYNLANTRWELLNPSPAAPLLNTLSGLTLSTAGASANFAVAAGAATDSTNAALMTLAASMTKTTAAWTVGSGGGSLDVGSIANSTWYHAHLVKRLDTGIVDVVTSLAPGRAATVTMTLASPGVITFTAHGLQANCPVVLTTTGALPTGLTAGTQYFVKTVVSVDTFTVSATQGGAAINTSVSQSGVHTCTANPILPTNYTLFRRIGSMKTNGSAQWTLFTQYADKFIWSAIALDTNGAFSSAQGVTHTVPTGFVVEALVRVDTSSLVVNSTFLLNANIEAAVVPAAGNYTNIHSVSGAKVSATVSVFTDESGHTRISNSGSDLINIELGTYGWIDTRGKG